jgi:hypothetical protein
VIAKGGYLFCGELVSEKRHVPKQPDRCEHQGRLQRQSLVGLIVILFLLLRSCDGREVVPGQGLVVVYLAPPVSEFVQIRRHSGEARLAARLSSLASVTDVAATAIRNAENSPTPDVDSGAL